MEMHPVVYVIAVICIVGVWSAMSYIAGKREGVVHGYDVAMDSIRKREIAGPPCAVEAVIRANKDGKYSVHFGEYVEGKPQPTYCTEIDNRYDTVGGAIKGIRRFFPEAIVYGPDHASIPDGGASQAAMDAATNVSTMG